MKGHGLRQEGAAFKGTDCSQCTPLFGMRTSYGVGGDGHGRCSCGAMSEHLPSGAARKRWHREHKAAVEE